MLKTRIIPCLDVNNGRVVKGVQFVDIQDAYFTSSSNDTTEKLQSKVFLFYLTRLVNYSKRKPSAEADGLFCCECDVLSHLP